MIQTQIPNRKMSLSVKDDTATKGNEAVLALTAPRQMAKAKRPPLTEFPEFQASLGLMGHKPSQPISVCYPPCHKHPDKKHAGSSFSHSHIAKPGLSASRTNNGFTDGQQ
jgi:hypothetical protein